jgi:hypothetical protein
MAWRLGEDPLIMMQHTHIVKGKAGFSAQYVIARANRSGVFKGRIKFREVGKPGSDNYVVTAFATLAETGEEVEFSASMEMAKAEGWTGNAKYRSMPQVMLRYRAATFLVRLNAPDVMLGANTAEEIEDVVVSRADVDHAHRPSLGTAAPPRQIEAPVEDAPFEPVREREPAEVRAEEPASASAAQPSGREEHPSRGPVAPQVQDAPTGRQEAKDAEPPKPDEREALKALIEVEVKRLGGRGRVCEVMGWDISAWKDVASWKFGVDRLTATLEKLKAAEPKSAKPAESDEPAMP